MKHSPKKERRASYLRTFVFGVEDSLASTVGLLSGVAAASASREVIFLTGVVLIFVEAVSMAAGSFLSEESAEDYLSGKETNDGRPVVEAGIMFGSYVLSGLIPLAPYLLIPGPEAFYYSIGVSAVALFVLGLASGMLSRTRPLRSALRMLAIGGLAIAVGIAVGALVSI